MLNMDITNITTYTMFSKDDIFVCGQCKIMFNSLEIYLEHKNSCLLKVPKVDDNSKDENIQIEKSKKISLEENVSNCENKLICNICHKLFKKHKSLEMHKKIHSGEKGFQCPLCGRCFTQSGHLQRHLQSHKVWPGGLSDTTPKSISVDLLSYACPYCEANLSNYNHFRGHLKTHSSLKKFKCIQNDCVSLFDDLELLLDHVTHNHTPPSYLCHLCSNIFNSLSDIALHQHHHVTNDIKDKKKFKCTQCDATFVKRTTLALHLASDNHEKLCIHCNKKFASDKRLRLHLRTHSTSKPYQCNICQQSFQMKKYLDTHLLKHGEGQYSCNVCNLKFKRQDVLSRHMKIHQDSKKYQCPFKDKLCCNMQFSRKDKLNLHIKKHTKRKFVTSQEKKMENKQGSTLEILIVPMSES